MERGGRLTRKTENVLIDALLLRGARGAKPSPLRAPQRDGHQRAGMHRRACAIGPRALLHDEGRAPRNGAGLSTVYGIVQQHGGMVHLDERARRSNDGGGVFSGRCTGLHRRAETSSKSTPAPETVTTDPDRRRRGQLRPQGARSKCSNARATARSPPTARGRPTAARANGAGRISPSSTW